MVVAERYPLEEFFSMDAPTDGPRLQSGATSQPGLFARMEMRTYRRIGRPDLVLALQADVDTLHDRKPNTPMPELRAKAAATRALAARSDVFALDAERPYEEVLLAAKTVIWGALSETR